jgi:hypothetical protein
LANLIKSFAVTVTTAGTPVRLSETDIFITEAVVRPLADNEDNILIGDEDTQVYFIQPGEPFRIAGLAMTRIAPLKNSPFVNLKDVWIDAVENGDSVAVAYIERG